MTTPHTIPPDSAIFIKGIFSCTVTRIHPLITAKFHTNVSQDKIMKGWPFMCDAFKVNCDIIMFCTRNFLVWICCLTALQVYMHHTHTHTSLIQSYMDTSWQSNIFSFKLQKNTPHQNKNNPLGESFISTILSLNLKSTVEQFKCLGLGMLWQ